MIKKLIKRFKKNIFDERYIKKSKLINNIITDNLGGEIKNE